ncbi:MAG: hypothetical protein Q9174_003037 [Haloplaca sp. 1 TL-2023]
MSGLMNKVKDAISGDKHQGDTTGTHQGHNEHGQGYSTTEGGMGSHGSNMGNKVDPRVDSDLDGNRHTSGTTSGGMTGSHGTGSGMTGSGMTGSHGTGSGMTGSGMGGGMGTGHSSTTAGPHSSSMGNKADPRVDSDLDGRRGMETGTGHHGTGSGMTGSGMTGSGMTGSGMSGSNTTGTGYGSSGYGSNTGGSTTAGPHSSNMGNKADPRVDSDLDGRRGMETGSHGTSGGYGSSTGTGITGSGLGSGSTGHHGSHGGVGGKVDDLVHGGEHHTDTANRLDPHVSGGRGPTEHASVPSTGTHGSSTGMGSGPGSTTAGPHSSGMANKADPRVDSDLDGRRGMETGSHGTTGGYGSSTGTGYGSNTGMTGTGSGYGSSDTSAGPHSSNMGNKADPRVDSDLDGRRGMETGSHGTHGTTGGYGSSSDTGYGSNAGMTGTGSGYGSSSATHGRGTDYNDTTSSTGAGGSTGAGPHKSSMMNKLDPRVDSDMDGKKGAMK